jgi:hypothetical protein
MPDGGASWLHLIKLYSGEEIIISFPHNNFSFHHQLSNELTDGSVTAIITHSIYINNIILIRAFLLVIEMHMSGRVIFCLAKLDCLRSNSAAIRALGLNSLLSFSFTLYYLALE